MSELNHHDDSGFEKVERELAKFILPEVSVNRDELMYRSGYEAAVAVAEHDGSKSHKSQAISRTTSNATIWKSTTLVFGSVAALLAIMLVMQLPVNDPSRRVVKSSSAGLPGGKEPVAEEEAVAAEADSPTEPNAFAGSYSKGWSGGVAGLLQFPIQSVSLQDFSSLSLRQKLVRIERSSMKQHSPVASQSAEQPSAEQPSAEQPSVGPTPLSSFGSLNRLQSELF